MLGVSNFPSSPFLLLRPGDTHVNILKRIAIARQFPQMPAPVTHQSENVRPQIYPVTRGQGAAKIISLRCRDVEVFDLRDLLPAIPQGRERRGNLGDDLAAVANAALQVFRRAFGPDFSLLQ